jgi:hypothetical protein
VLGLHGVAGEAAGVEHEHHVKAVLHRVLDQPLEVRTLIREPAGLEVDVLLHQAHVVLGGVARDGLALPVGGVAAALLLGGLADVCGRAAGLLWLGHLLCLLACGLARE